MTVAEAIEILSQYDGSFELEIKHPAEYTEKVSSIFPDNENESVIIYTT